MCITDKRKLDFSDLKYNLREFTQNYPQTLNISI